MVTPVSPTDPLLFSASIVTPIGRGAVSVWRLRLPLAVWSELPFETSIAHDPITQPVGRILFGTWDGEEVLLIRRAENEWELHTHGGQSAARRIEQSLRSQNCSILEWPEYIRKERTTLELEYLRATTESVTWRTTEYLLRHPTDSWRKELVSWERSFNLGPDELFSEMIASRCREVLEWAAFGQRLTEPAKVVLAGAPNAGKSSLMNRLAGYERVIVRNEPGTTRDLVGVEIAIDGIPVNMIDTAGLRLTDDPLESEGIRRTRRQLEGADLIVFLVDRTAPLQAGEELPPSGTNSLIIIDHKSDQNPHPRRQLPKDALAVSSLTGEGVELMMSRILTLLIPKQPDFGDVFPVSRRQCKLLNRLLRSVEAKHWSDCQQIVKELLDGSLSSLDHEE